ncbi:MAG: hypothetical protein HY921_08685 [Elusimicrobia bacterium]|nr:hypothetical protein [Elusimicrobiota bacterium]
MMKSALPFLMTLFLGLGTIPARAQAPEAAPKAVSEFDHFDLRSAKALFERAGKPRLHGSRMLYILSAIASKEETIYNPNGIWKQLGLENYGTKNILPALEFRVDDNPFLKKKRWELYTSKLFMDEQDLGRYHQQLETSRADYSGNSIELAGPVAVLRRGRSLAFEWTYSMLPAENANYRESSCRLAHRCRFADEKGYLLLCQVLHTHYKESQLSFAEVYYEGYFRWRVMP